MKPNLEYDLLHSEWIVNKCKHSPIYSQNLYAALCNNRFFYGTEEWACSWRHSGGIISDINNGNGYMDYYCSGICGGDGNVPEGFITEEIRLDLIRLGWIAKPYENIQRRN